MAEKIKDFTLPVRSRGRLPTYAQYCDGAVWRLTEGVDFTNYDTARHGLYQMARRKGVKAHLRMNKKIGLIEVQCIPRESPNDA